MEGIVIGSIYLDLGWHMYVLYVLLYVGWHLDGIMAIIVFILDVQPGESIIPFTLIRILCLNFLLSQERVALDH